MAEKSAPNVNDRKRVAYIAVYSLNGGPVHPDVIRRLETAAEREALMYGDLAISMKVE